MPNGWLIATTPEAAVALDRMLRAVDVAAAILREEHIEEDGACFACETAWPCWAGDLIAVARPGPAW
jgi:hypothetical protein